MTEKERRLALHCLKANSDYHSEICEECIKYPCSHSIQDDVTETIIKELEQESKTDILDKIRAEIKELQLIGYATVDGKREIASRAVMQIIDKYKTESEGKE